LTFQWYEVQDLVVTDILPQMVALSETYFQVYELKQQQGAADWQQQQQQQGKAGGSAAPQQQQPAAMETR